MKFGENLRKLRKLKKLSQEDLAEKLNVSRQSVSKWETGESYPEMNNILELCKIFHCSINDLVNNSIIDADLLGEDIKVNIVKFKKDQQVGMKNLSKAISIISKICRIIVMISIPIVAISMIILGIIINKVSIDSGEIRFNSVNDKISIVEEKDKISIKINDITVADTMKQSEILRIKEVLENGSKWTIFGYIEIGFAFLIVNLILVTMILRLLEKLFNNINKGDTPFTLQNVGYIKKMAYLMIAVTIFPNIMGVIFEMFLNVDLDIGFELFSLVEILFLFSISYIFQYGYEIQLDSKGKMYGDYDE